MLADFWSPGQLRHAGGGILRLTAFTAQSFSPNGGFPTHFRPDFMFLSPVFKLSAQLMAVRAVGTAPCCCGNATTIVLLLQNSSSCNTTRTGPPKRHRQVRSNYYFRNIFYIYDPPLPIPVPEHIWHRLDRLPLLHTVMCLTPEHNSQDTDIGKQ